MFSVHSAGRQQLHKQQQQQTLLLPTVVNAYPFWAASSARLLACLGQLNSNKRLLRQLKPVKWPSGSQRAPSPGSQPTPPATPPAIHFYVNQLFALLVCLRPVPVHVPASVPSVACRRSVPSAMWGSVGFLARPAGRAPVSLRRLLSAFCGFLFVDLVEQPVELFASLPYKGHTQSQCSPVRRFHSAVASVEYCLHSWLVISAPTPAPKSGAVEGICLHY